MAFHNFSARLFASFLRDPDEYHSGGYGSGAPDSHRRPPAPPPSRPVGTGRGDYRPGYPSTRGENPERQRRDIGSSRPYPDSRGGQRRPAPERRRPVDQDPYDRPVKGERRPSGQRPRPPYGGQGPSRNPDSYGRGGARPGDPRSRNRRPDPRDPGPYYEDDEFLDDFEPDQERQNRRRNKALMIVLDFAIVALLGVAAFFYFWPKVVNSKQKDVERQILEEMDKNPHAPITMRVRRGDLQVPGGEQLESALAGDEFVNEQRDPDEMVNLTFIGRIVIAKIGCKCPISADASRESLRFGVGCLPSTPAVNENGLTAIFGHRFLDKGRDFNRLGEIKEGDVFYIDYSADQTRYHYDVVEVKIINPGKELEDNVFQDVPDNQVLLVTCHPLEYGSSKQRLLVYGKLSGTEKIPN